MGGARKLSLALAAASCAAILAACGGGDDSTSSTPAGTAGAESTVEGGGASGSGGGEQKGGGEQAGGGGDQGSGGGSSPGGDGNGSGGSPGGGGSSGVSGQAGFDFSGEPTKHEHPKPVEGSRADGFLTPGGDNSIQEYGEEQDSDERAAAMLPISALYRALYSGDWQEVCSTYLSANNVRQIQQLSEQSPKLKGKSCAEVLSGLTQSTGRVGPDTPDGGIVSFRTEGDTGFAIYWGIDGKGYAFPLKSEAGAWKLTSLAPTPLQIG